MQHSSFEVLQWCVYAMNETTESNAEISKEWDTGCNLGKKKNPKYFYKNERMETFR